jgi:adenylate cyclase class 2
MPNIEIKARYADQEKARKIAQRLDAMRVGIDHQIDTYFKTVSGRLKLRESTLSGAQLVPYVRPNLRGPKKSTYLVLPVADPTSLKTLFDQILGTDIVVDKMREIFLIGNVRVHIDSVKNLGNFFEFEAVYQDPKDEPQEHLKVAQLIKDFEIPEVDLMNDSYRELLMRTHGTS